MTKYSKINMVYRLQKWMDSVPGQTFLNYAYSWGAAVVILGTLFKLTHLPGANLMLYLGMGTEVVVFFLSAFDRPFDKTADGMELPTHLATEENDLPEGMEVTGQSGATAPAVAAVSGGGVIGGGNIVVGGGSGTIGEEVVSGGGTVGGGSGQTIIIGGGGVIGGGGHSHSETSETSGHIEFSETSEHIETSATPATAVPASIPPLTPDMTEATNAYVEELKNLTEVLERVSEQSRRLTTDSEEMENLNRTLTGICKVYEMQLKSASSQIGTIDEINEQTKKMAQQIEQLNNIYARMIEAMTMKMKAE